VVECACLENKCRRKATAGSNPVPSAIFCLARAWRFAPVVVGRLVARGNLPSLSPSRRREGGQDVER
jgi:hypothetical protein